jgi:hypothetical protein
MNLEPPSWSCRRLRERVGAASAMPLRIVELTLFALLLVACDPPRKKPSSTDEVAAAPLDTPAQGPLVPTGGDGAASRFLSDAADYARHHLKFAKPRFSYVLLGCADLSGHLDPLSSSCPGSVVATFEDEPRGEEVALVVVGKTGMVGGRSSRRDVISLKPAACTIESFLDAAKQAGVRWSPASDVFISYGPSTSGAAWMVKRGDAVLFSATDPSCANLRDGRSSDGGPPPR